jgi:hypothetical protein
MCDAPADVTVGRGSLSRDDKKDIKNGTRARSFTALSALFDVSLYFDWSDQTIPNPNANPTVTLRAALVDGGRRVFFFLASAAFNSRETPQNGNDVFGEFVHHLLSVLGRLLWRVNILRQNRRNLEFETIREEIKKEAKNASTDILWA